MAQLPGGSASDFWWIKPQPADDPLPAIRMGMQNAHQQRLDKIALAEQAYKAQVREEISMGAAELSRVIAENFKSGDISSPESQSRIWEVGTKYPTLLSSTVWKEYGDMMQNQEQIKLRKFQTESLNIYRQQMGGIAQQRADALTQRAETGELLAEEKLELDRLKFELSQNIGTIRIQEMITKMDAINKGIDLRTSELEQTRRRTELLEQRMTEPDKQKILDFRAKEKALKKDMSDMGSPPGKGPFGGVPKRLTEYNAKIAELKALDAERAEIYKRYTEPAPTATPEDVLPVPDSIDKLKKGQRYNTLRGIATWDGEKFVQ